MVDFRILRTFKGWRPDSDSDRPRWLTTLSFFVRYWFFCPREILLA